MAARGIGVIRVIMGIWVIQAIRVMRVIMTDSRVNIRKRICNLWY